MNLSPQQRTVRIGGASGFWGDSSVGAPQLVASGQIDYLVFDYLAELTMSILAAARQKNAALGYATDFVTVAMRAVLKDVVQRGIRVVSNAGGVNPQACAAALQTLAEELGVNVKIAVVTGDDVMPLIPQLREAKEPVRELQSGVPLPERVVTANAYLGALPVKAALDAGANVVITGRCVDSAVTLGVLMHEFGWSVDDYDRLAAGSLAGHIIECGCQATGGLFTDWDSVPDWAHIGYPIVECRFDGDFTVTKPAGTGGLVAPAVVAEQILYEIGDPSAYLLPDVTCDFTGVTLVAEGPDRVSVSGARGRAPTSTYKVCATYVDGFKLSAQLTIVGFDADAKARRTGEAILERTSELLKRARTPALCRDDDRDARRGILLRTPCARGRNARSGAAAHRDAPRQGRARTAGPRGGPGGNVLGAGHDGRRRPRFRFAVHPSIRLPARQIPVAAAGSHRRPHPECSRARGHGAGRGGTARVRCALGRRRIRHGRDRASIDPRGLGPQRRQGR